MKCDTDQPSPSLSDEQRLVLFNKATEAPFSGKYLHLNLNGTYACANCRAVLFSSKAKFDSGCGWPSFDSAMLGSVKYTEDHSHNMIRTEISCAQCGGHLGHVFDDGPKETTGRRYCVNSLSLDFEQKDQ